jgi:cytidylate kinase
MHPNRTLPAVSGYLSAQAISPRTPDRPRKTRRFVTISREAGAGGRSVGRRVVDRLNRGDDHVPWTLFDRELVDAVIEQHDLPRELSRYMTEAGIRRFEEAVSSVFGQSHSSFTLTKRMNQTILALGGLGNAVLLGRGSNLLTRALTGGFHVRLVADRKTRLEHLKSSQDLDDPRADARLRKLDKDRSAYVRDNFGADVADVLAYDCVINTGLMSFDDAADLIAVRVRDD